MTFAGTWNLTIATPMGAQAATLDLTEPDGPGGTVSGVARSGDESVTLDGITADGNRLTWKQEVTKPFKVNVTFDVTVDGDAMTGIAKPGMFPASKVTGTRA